MIRTDDSLKGLNIGVQYVVSSESEVFDKNKDSALLTSIDSSRRILTANDGIKIGEMRMRP